METVRRVIDECSSGRNFLPGYDPKDTSRMMRLRMLDAYGAHIFEYAGPVPRGDRSLALHAIELGAHEMSFVGQNLRRDQDFLLEGIRRNPDSFRYIDNDLRDDFDFVRAALKVDAGTETRSRNGRRHASLEHVSIRLRGNVTIVCEAVRREGADGQLEFAAVELRDDPRVLSVLGSCCKRGHFEWAVKYHMGEWEIAKSSMANLFPGLSTDSREFFLECTKRDPSLYKHINREPEFRHLVLSPSAHRELVHNFLDNGFSLCDLFEENDGFFGLRRRRWTMEWETDYEVVSKAVAQGAPQRNMSYATMSQAALSFAFANAKLRNSWQIFSVALKTDPVGVAEVLLASEDDHDDEILNGRINTRMTHKSMLNLRCYSLELPKD